MIPRAHVAHYWALSEHQSEMLAAACLLVGKGIQEALEPSGMNLITSRGAAAEQTVPHVHLHILPRWETDAVGPIWPPKHPPTSVSLVRAARLVRAALAS